ncbi:hypothetical protein VCHA43P277_160090 [Vibrio chagasii]|nr:hypothetical protein VCHA34P126_140085 [Vibrio chagasii]CAH6985845.1 hypothetical protein VCHA43P277_160090 [Vibrio chagasii]CAH7033719.1 hypothetical protein VCHA41O247_160091 [Vibrio chagasii]CAH7242474.1 hypothetical protein VCHA50P420_160044 [Vibrio chagasii]
MYRDCYFVDVEIIFIKNVSILLLKMAVNTLLACWSDRIQRVLGFIGMSVLN